MQAIKFFIDVDKRVEPPIIAASSITTYDPETAEDVELMKVNKQVGFFGDSLVLTYTEVTQDGKEKVRQRTYNNKKGSFTIQQVVHKIVHFAKLYPPQRFDNPPCARYQYAGMQEASDGAYSIKW